MRYLYPITAVFPPQELTFLLSEGPRHFKEA